MTDETAPRTPLTLDFAPESLEGDSESQPVLVCEPSFQHDGRIFCAVHPFGQRIGLHLLPEDALRLRNHLSKLLMEPEPDTATPVDWQKRIQAAAARVKRPKRFRFRVEFVFGSLQGTFGRFDG